MLKKTKEETPKSFLIIEDEPLFQLAFEKQLKDIWPNASYYKANTGTEGLRILNDPKTELPDVIILDYHLADNETGAEFLEHEFVRELPFSTKIIICSAEASKEERAKLLRSNKNCSFLQKPATGEELVSFILK